MHSKELGSCLMSVRQQQYTGKGIPCLKTVIKDGTGVMKRFLAAAVSAAIFFALTGCGNSNSIPVTDSSVSSDSYVESEQDSVTESYEEEPKEVKAAVLSRNAARMWLLAGGEFAAAVEEAQDVAGLPDDVVWAGSEEKPSVQSILKTEPDVIIADRTVSGYTNIRKQFSDADCEILEVSANSFEEYDSSMKLLTEKTGNSEAYSEYVEAVAERNSVIISNALEAAHKVEVTVTQSPGSDLSDEKVSEEAREVHYKGRTPYYMVIRVGEENCRAMSNDDFICSMLNDFGMTNANKSGQQVIVWKTDDAEGKEESGDSSLTTKKETTDSSVTTKEENADSSVTATKETENVYVPKMPPGATAIDTFAGEVDTRESEDAGRRTFENLLANNPDFVFIIYEGDEKAAAANCNELVKSCESWSSIFAVQSGRVYDLPQSSFRYQPYEMWDLAYEYLYQSLFNL